MVSNDEGRPTRFYDAYVFDMDGTIYLGEHLLPGVLRTVRELRGRGIPVRFLSNNPTRDPAQYADKLGRLGLPTSVEEIATSMVSTTRWLRRTHPHAVVYPIGERPLVDSLTRAGIALSEDPAKIDIVLASYDRTFTYRKLQIAFDALWFHHRAILVATNPDRFCPFPGGHGEPDCAAIVAAIEACTGVRCQFVVGKPNPAMLDLALEGTGVNASTCLMVGDRLSTDIRMAAEAGIDSAMPLTGESTREDARALPESQRPTYILKHLDELIPDAAGTSRTAAAQDISRQ